jgi:hypothetical protein
MGAMLINGILTVARSKRALIYSKKDVKTTPSYLSISLFPIPYSRPCHSQFAMHHLLYLTLSSHILCAFPNREPPYGLITLVPLINTDPDLWSNPCMRSGRTPGLTPNRLLGALKRGKHLDYRDHWQGDPCKMQERDHYDHGVCDAKTFLYNSQVKLKHRLQAQGVEVDCMEVD